MVDFKLLRPVEAAQMLGISKTTLKRLRADGSGPSYVQIGKRRIGYSPSDLERWAYQRTIPQGSADFYLSPVAA